MMTVDQYVCNLKDTEAVDLVAFRVENNISEGSSVMQVTKIVIYFELSENCSFFDRHLERRPKRVRMESVAILQGFLTLVYS